MLMLYREYKIGPVVEIEGSPDVGRCTLEELLSRLQFWGAMFLQRLCA